MEYSAPINLTAQGFAVILICFIASCSPGTNESDYPFENTYRDIAFDFEALDGFEARGWLASGKVLDLSDTDSEIGFFGSADGMSATADSGFIVLDGQNKRLVAFSRGLEYKWAFGSEGQGPDEFVRPEFLNVDGAVVAVYDKYLGIKVFEENGSSLLLRATIPFTGEVSGICIADEKVAIVGMSLSADGPLSKGMLHYFDLDGAYIDTYWEVIHNKNNHVTSIVGNTGVVACDRKNDRILFAAKNSPVVRIYNYKVNSSFNIKLVNNAQYRKIVGSIVDGRQSGGPEENDQFHTNIRLGVLGKGEYVLQVMKGFKRGTTRPVDTGLYSIAFRIESSGKIKENALYLGKESKYVLGPIHNGILAAIYETGGLRIEASPFNRSIYADPE